jgi:hypothetical protein
VTQARVTLFSRGKARSSLREPPPPLDDRTFGSQTPARAIAQEDKERNRFEGSEREAVAMRVVTNFALLGGGLLLDTALAVRVVPGSPCEKYCGNVLDNTVSTDITCNEKNYVLSAGTVFEGCTTCELSSPYSANKQTDQQWMLCAFPTHPQWTRHSIAPIRFQIAHTDF